MTAGGKTLDSRFPASGESATTRARGCPGWDRGEGAGRGRRLQVAVKGCGGEGRPETRENSAVEPPEPLHLRPPPPSSAPPRCPPGGRRLGAGCREAGGPGSAASPDRSQLRSGPAGLHVTCALPPVPGDHCLAGDGVQPGGALRLLAAGGREGAETERERGRGRSRGAEAAQPRLALPALASLPRPPGPPRRPRLLT